MAASATVRAIGQMQETQGTGSSNPGPEGMAPKVGLNPTSPVCAGGRRLDPPASGPIASATSPPATADTGPQEEPPGVSDKSSGCRVAPWSRFVVCPLHANSDVLDMAEITAPARSRASTGSAL